MFKFVPKILLSVSLVAASALTDASLITNGSFEQTTFADNSTSVGSVFNTDLVAYKDKDRAWDVFEYLPGWETSYGNGIELQKNIVTLAQDGSHHVELDSHPRGASNTAMTQTVDSLTVGADYLLEFFYKPRTNNRNDNGINVFWYDSAVGFSSGMEAALIADSTRNLTPNWALQTVSFTAEAESMNLSFAAFGTQNSLGGLIDNVSLEQLISLPAGLLPIGTTTPTDTLLVNSTAINSSSVTSVPEPSMFILFLTAIVLLLVSQRRQAK
ncbi:MAG: PEP-CTERM sorting domain-containing protein [Colwellia sp.]|nr:PEP-CTERM sorting domain-containing protein [Colwellia sp.]